MKSVSPAIKKALNTLPFFPILLEIASASEMEFWIVGGTLRDLFLNKPIKDLDCLIRGQAHRFLDKVAQTIGAKKVQLGKKPWTTWRLAKKNFFIDFLVLKNSDTLEGDLARRDFSINAMAYDPREDILWDPLNGLKDLERKIIRRISLQTFQDDPLRLLRALRLKVSLPGFRLDPDTFLAIKDERFLIHQGAPERILQELDLMFSEGDPSEGLLLLEETGLLGELFPELAATLHIDQGIHHQADVFGHTLQCLMVFNPILAQVLPWMEGFTLSKEDRLILIYALLYHDVGKPATQSMDEDGMIHFYGHEKVSCLLARDLIRRLRMGKAREEKILCLVRHHLKPFHLVQAGFPSRGVRRMIHRVKDLFPLLLLHYVIDRDAHGLPDEEARQALQKFWAIYRKEGKTIQSPPKLVSGEEVMRYFNLKQGPEVGKILKAIQQQQVDGKIQNRRQALQFLQALLAQRDETPSGSSKEKINR